MSPPAVDMNTTSLPPHHATAKAGEQFSAEQTATMLKAMLAQEQNSKSFANDNGQTRVLGSSDVSPRAAVSFKNCKDSTYTLDTTVTKLMVEGCEGCTFLVQGKVLTHMLEMWRSNNCKVVSSTVLKTVQLDHCNDTNVSFDTKENFHSLVWAGCQNLHLEFEDAAMSTLDTGYDVMKKEQSDLNRDTDQYICRFIQGKLLQELVIRLPNGFPTTEREARHYDEQQERMAKALAADCGITINRKVPSDKTGRNEKCKCGSGKKFKVCCGRH